MCKNSNLSKIISEDTRSFFKQFYGSVTEEDYLTMRLGFIMKHCSGNPKFNFYKYMIRALEADFKKVVGISWYLWAMLIIFLLLNVQGWYVYIWISAVPFIMGTSFKKVIFDENVAEGLTNWAQNARRRNARGTNGGGVQMASPPTRSTEQGTARLI
uniref:MLO-like protein n=1 Tax=Leersia perrieri TaxID=77586 RepID=A0A0D9VH80_9ORYZ